MRRAARIAGVVGTIVLLAALVFLIPTIWWKPWSIDHFYARVFLEFLLDRPMLLSQLRLLEPYGIDFHSDELDDFSVEFTRESARKARRNLEVLRSYDRESLSPDRRLSRDVLEWVLATSVEGEPFLFHDYPLNQFSGVQSALPDFMLNVHQVNDAADARNYVARLEGFGLALDQVVEGMRYRVARAIVPPRFVIQHVADEVAEFTSSGATRNPLYSGFEQKLDALADLDEADRRELLAAARAALEEVVYPAYRRVAASLPELRAASVAGDGVWRLPGGADYYAWVLRLHTTSSLDADAIHEQGLAEVERLHARMRRLLAEQGYGSTDLAGTLQELNREQRFLYPDDDEGRRRILADYQAIIDDVAPRLPEFFGRLPRAPVRVERVPQFKQEGAAGAYYRPPPLDGSRPGIFYVNLRSVAEVRRFGMRTLAFHEAIPGHHLQIAIAQELEDVPFFRRVLPFTAFTEGWALYAERLAREVDLHPTPWDELGQLEAETFRAVRLVLDTGIHARRWSRKRAIEYMLANTGMVRSDVVAEVERYIVNPGQACAYKIGQLGILELREEARERLGPRFDLREFHDVVLGSGSLPLVLLQRVVRDWIRERSLGA